MKNTIKVLITMLVFTLFASLLLTGCNINTEKEYSGPEILAIEYITVDFMGGASYKRKLDFTNGNICEMNNYPWDEENSDKDYKLIYTFDTSKKQEIINKFYNIGILSLDERYEDYNVVDGGSWTLIIEYKDGTKRTSTGINAGPSELFTDADYAFYEITGKEFFGRVREI